MESPRKTPTVDSIRRFAAACAILVLLASGCASPPAQGEHPSDPADAVSSAEVVYIPTQQKYEPPDPASRGRVHVRVPEGYGCDEYMEDVEPYTGEAVELEAAIVDLGDAGSLRIVVDDAGFFDWWYSGSMYGAKTAAEYVDVAGEDRRNSSWPISVGGHDGVVLIQGSAEEGGETGGDAFVFLDGATIAINSKPRGGEALAADAYSRFFRSQEVTDLLNSLAITAE